MNIKKRHDIEVIRIIAMFCIVMGHCFAIYGAWQTPLNAKFSSEAHLYQAVNPLLIYYALPIFISISGYLIGYKKTFDSPSFNFTSFVWKKTKRLYIPAVFFSIAYRILFHREAFLDQSSYIRLLIDGEGHLWFLYVLFSLYVLSYPIYRISQNLTKGASFIIPISVVVSILSCFFDLGTSISTIFFYQLFFLLGIYIGNNHLQKKIVHKKHLYLRIVCNCTIYITIFTLLALLKETEYTALIYSQHPRLQYFQHWFFRLLIGSLSILLTFSLLPRPLSKNKFLENISSLSYKLYITHQFILMGLLYSTTSLLERLYQHTVWLFPLTLFLIVFTTSLLLSFLFQKIPILKHL
ncbi:acyltransferase family protein [Porphyromonas endodontalis]